MASGKRTVIKVNGVSLDEINDEDLLQNLIDANEDAATRKILLARLQQVQGEGRAKVQKNAAGVTSQDNSSAAMDGADAISSGTPAKTSPINGRPTNPKDALLHWCFMKTKSYDNVNVQNFSSSWADGLAFCALLHHFFPEDIDYEKLSSKTKRNNFSLAFKVAEEKAKVYPLLEVDDMLRMGPKPDWKCVYCYMQSLYRGLKPFDPTQK